jgi:excisionase family DNA binding protein
VTETTTRDSSRNTSDSDPLEDLIADWCTVQQAADRLGTNGGRVKRMLRDGELLAVRTRNAREARIPALLLGDDRPVKGLPGTITLLRDARYDDREALTWLFTDDPSLPGRPVDALQANAGTEVRRRAQAMV